MLIEGDNTTDTEAIDAINVFSTLMKQCYPFLFSKQTKKELTKHLKAVKNKKFGYTKLAALINSISYVISEKTNESKEQITNPDNKTDELIQKVLKEADRQFIYLLRDYMFNGEKFLITSDSDFFPKDPESKDQFNEYQKKHNFRIISVKDFSNSIDFSTDQPNQKDSRSTKGKARQLEKRLE